jgi:hypothetical protein
LNIKTSIIDLESIKKPAISAEDASSIEALANSIVELGGLLRPPILRLLGNDEYEVLSGQLEFHAYLQAHQFDDSLPDRLTALIVDKKNEVAVQKQLSTTELISPVIVNPSATDTSSLIAIGNLDAKIERLLNIHSKSISDSYTIAINNLAVKFDQLSIVQSDSPKKVDRLPAESTQKVESGQMLSLLAAFNRIDDDEISEKISAKLKFISKDKFTKIREVLVAAKKQKKTFDSLGEVQKIIVSKHPKLIGDKGMLKAVDQWHQ